MKTCSQLRQAISERPTNGRSNGWAFTCAECGVLDSGQSCWETCGGSPCCCAPLTMTCDFCEIYLEHRREIAGLISNGHSIEAGLAPAPTPTTANGSYPKGGTHLMEKVQFNVPRLWADHHTLKVRNALLQVVGVQEVIASSAFRMVMVTFDPALTTSSALAAVLGTAGYPVAVSGGEIVAQPVPVADGRKDPAWDRLGFRVARTDARDVKK